MSTAAQIITKKGNRLDQAAIYSAFWVLWHSPATESWEASHNLDPIDSYKWYIELSTPSRSVV